MLGYRVRFACQARFAANSIDSVQERIDRQFRYFEALGKFTMFADGAIFDGARVNFVADTSLSICWKSAFYPGPRHQQVILDGRAELLPLGFHGQFDLYLQRPQDGPGGANAAVVSRSGAGDVTTLDSRIGMPADVAHALHEGMLRARLLAAGPP